MSERKQRRWSFNLGASKAERKADYQEEQWRNSPAAYGNSIRSYGASYITYLDVYRSQPAVRQVVSFIAENMAQVPIKTYRRAGEDERTFLRDHPVQHLLDSPSPQLSQFEFMRDLITDLEVFDVAFYQLGGNIETGYVVTRLFPDSVELIGYSSLTGPKTFRVHRADGTHSDLDPSQVLYLHGYGSERGISQMETLRRILAEDHASGVYREGLYKNGMRNAGVIERPLEAPDWSPTARDRFLDQLTDRHTGETGGGRPLLLEEGMTWKSDQISMRSEEYVQGREFTTRAVANAFRISPSILGLSDAPYASITAYNQQLYQNALAPRMTFVTQALERQLLSLDDRQRESIYLEFNLEAKLRGSFAEQAALAQMALGQGTPWMTVDEWRARIDLPPLTPEEKDELLGIAGAPAPEGGVDTGAGLVDQPSPSEDAPKRTSGVRTKAAERGIVARREKYSTALTETLEKTFARAAKQAKALGADGFKAERWERELSSDLRPELETITVAEGARKATQLGGTFDKDRTKNYLDAKADGVSTGIASGIDDVLKRHEADTDDGSALKTALKALAVQHAVTLATSTMNFAREEAGEQTTAKGKTWTTTSEDSRHADIDGETAKLGGTFSNGLGYPGDPAGDPEETVNCLCVLDIQ